MRRKITGKKCVFVGQVEDPDEEDWRHGRVLPAAEDLAAVDQHQVGQDLGLDERLDEEYAGEQKSFDQWPVL